MQGTVEGSWLDSRMIACFRLQWRSTPQPSRSNFLLMLPSRPMPSNEGPMAAAVAYAGILVVTAGLDGVAEQRKATSRPFSPSSIVSIGERAVCDDQGGVDVIRALRGQAREASYSELMER